jgi:hypothetical protein
VTAEPLSNDDLQRAQDLADDDIATGRDLRLLLAEVHRLRELHPDHAEEKPPQLNGWPQLVDFRGEPMRIVTMESGGVDSTLCLTCGTEAHRKTVTLKLVDEASHIELRRRHAEPIESPDQPEPIESGTVTGQ